MRSSESCSAPHGSRTACEAFFDERTHTVTYVVSDRATGGAAVIDPVLDFDAESGRISTISIDRVLAYLAAQRLRVEWILETHVHADHLSGADRLRRAVGGRVAIGAHVRAVQATFATIDDRAHGFVPDGRQFDHLFEDGESFGIGGIEATAMYVPGHTPADVAYRIDGAVFVGDTLFMPDVGSARSDFPGGDARRLFASIRRLLALPPETALYVGHDYPPAARGPAWRTTVAEQRASNVHANDGVSADAFVAMRTARDATLGAPALMRPALQVNLRGGRLSPGDVGAPAVRVPREVATTR